MTFAIVAFGLIACGAGRGRPACPTPRIERLEPASAAASEAGLVTVQIIGCGFAAENTVWFADQRFDRVPSRDGGRQIAFVLPTTGHASSAAAPPPLTSGTYAIRIMTTSGESNAVDFVVR